MRGQGVVSGERETWLCMCSEPATNYPISFVVWHHDHSECITSRILYAVQNVFFGDAIVTVSLHYQIGYISFYVLPHREQIINFSGCDCLVI